MSLFENPDLSFHFVELVDPVIPVTTTEKKTMKKISKLPPLKLLF